MTRMGSTGIWLGERTCRFRTAADAGAALALDDVGPALYPLLEMGGDVERLVEEFDSSGDSGQRRVLLVTNFDGDVQIDEERVNGVIPWVPRAMPIGSSS